MCSQDLEYQQSWFLLLFSILTTWIILHFFKKNFRVFINFWFFSPQQHANSHTHTLSIMFNAFWFLDPLFFYLSMLSPDRDNVKQGTGPRAILKRGITLYCASVICRLSLFVAAAYLFMLLPICCWCCSWLLFAVAAGVSIFFACICCCCSFC